MPFAGGSNIIATLVVMVITTDLLRKASQSQFFYVFGKVCLVTIRSARTVSLN